MIHQEKTEVSRRLVTHIEQELGRALPPAIREAFLQIPRQLFLDHFYLDGQFLRAPSNSDEVAWNAWLSAVESDQALTTQRDARGRPTSSSSQPSVMARMLEALVVEPGQRVLEIGTGTGYNAALLAMLAGDPSLITTLDIDAYLAVLAAQRIQQVVGPGMTIEVCNGIEGEPYHAPYDRIIATASVCPVPSQWLHQLKPGGRLVMDLRGRLDGELMTLIKQQDGTVRGHPLETGEHVSFMPLRPSSEDASALEWLKSYHRLPVGETAHLLLEDQAYPCALHFATYEHFRSQNEGFNLWLQWSLPGLAIKWKSTQAGPLSAFVWDEQSQTVVVITPHNTGATVQVYGTRPLWSDIAVAYQDWLRAGKPGRQAHTLFIDEQGRQAIQVEYEGRTRTFLLKQEAS